MWGILWTSLVDRWELGVFCWMLIEVCIDPFRPSNDMVKYASLI